MFKEGDIVESISGRRLRILEVKLPDWIYNWDGGDITYLCQDTLDQLHPMWYTAKEFKQSGLRNKCECGSKHTSASKFHMFYCPEYKDMT